MSCPCAVRLHDSQLGLVSGPSFRSTESECVLPMSKHGAATSRRAPSPRLGRDGRRSAPNLGHRIVDFRSSRRGFPASQAASAPLALMDLATYLSPGMQPPLAWSDSTILFRRNSSRLRSVRAFRARRRLDQKSWALLDRFVRIAVVDDVTDAAHRRKGQGANLLAELDASNRASLVGETIRRDCCARFECARRVRTARGSACHDLATSSASSAGSSKRSSTSERVARAGANAVRAIRARLERSWHPDLPLTVSHVNGQCMTIPCTRAIPSGRLNPTRNSSVLTAKVLAYRPLHRLRVLSSNRAVSHCPRNRPEATLAVCRGERFEFRPPAPMQLRTRRYPRPNRESIPDVRSRLGNRCRISSFLPISAGSSDFGGTLTTVAVLRLARAASLGPPLRSRVGDGAVYRESLLVQQVAARRISSTLVLVIAVAGA